MDRRGRRQVATVLSVLCLGVALSAFQGVRADLPGLSLGWAALLHVERAAAMIAAVAVVLLVGVRALNRRFPVRFGHVEYLAEPPASEADLVQEINEQRLEALEKALGIDGSAHGRYAGGDHGRPR